MTKLHRLGWRRELSAWGPPAPVGAAGSWALWKYKCGTNLLPQCSAEEGKASVLQQSRWDDQV